MRNVPPIFANSRFGLSTRRTRRAFALPLVILLTLIGGLAVGLLLQRHSIQALAYQKRVDSYINHHQSAGIMECVLNWLQTTRGRIDTALGADGLAFTMELGTDPNTGQPLGQLRVYFEDGQGAALKDASAVFGRRREITEDVAYILENAPDEMKVEGMFRPMGPPEISMKSAPPVVIEALCLAIFQDQAKAAMAAEILIRNRGSSEDLPHSPTGAAGLTPTTSGTTPAAAQGTASNLMAALQPVKPTQQQQKELMAMLISSPTLYHCIAETRDSSGRLTGKSGGLYQASDAGKIETFKQRGAFLTWEQLPLKEE